MRDTPETLPYAKYLPDVYRFAFLMTGRPDTAADVLRHTVGRATRGGLNGIRDLLQAKRWLFAEARTLCAHAPGGDVPMATVPAAEVTGIPPDSLPPVPDIDVPSAHADDPPHQLALLFADVPEDERSALILFYLFLFDPAELAELLEIKPAELGPLLLRGRTTIQRRGGRYENLFSLQSANGSSEPPESPTDAPTHAVPDAA